MVDDGLFQVKDIKTGKIYEEPWKLCEDLLNELPKLNIFRPHQFIIDDEGDLYVQNTMDDTVYLDKRRFGVIWNYNHNRFIKIN